MTTAPGLRKGHDVGYFKAGHGADGCAGAMASAADLEPVSGFEPLTCRLQDGCSAC